MCHRLSLLMCSVVILAMAAAVMLHAQGGASATITGRVTDSQGAVLPDATVIVRDLNTGIERATKTTSGGLYSLSNLRPGDFTVRVTAIQNFAPSEPKNVHIDVGARQDVNFKLAPANVLTSVEVNAQAPFIESTKTDVSTVVNEADMERLPITSAPSFMGVSGVGTNMNDYIGLAATAPGVRFDTSGNSGDVIGPGSFNNRANVYNVDGGNITDLINSNRDVQGASVEEVEEFQVLTNNYNAEYGGAGGIIINVVTKSGGNKIHGDYHFYARGRNLGASNFFYNQGLANTPNPPTCPITPCPVEGRPRAPFFKHEQGFTLGGPLVKNKTFWFIAYERVQQGVPLQLLPPTGSISTSQPDRELMLSAKIDHQLTNSNHLSIRFNQHRATQDNGLTNVTTTASPDALVSGDGHDHTINGALTSALNPHLINEARVFWHRILGGAFPKSTLPGLQGPDFYMHANFCCPQVNEIDRTQVNDNLTWVHGTHTVKAGPSLSYSPYSSIFQQVHYGLWTFNGAYPFTPPTDPTNPPILYTFAAGPGLVSGKDNLWGLFVQDSWKMLKTLTVNYGLRWDYQAGAFRGGSIPTSGGRCLQGNGIIPACSSDLNNFQPRLGVAWAPQFKRGPIHWLLGDPDKSLVSAGLGEITQINFLNLQLDSMTFDGKNLLTGTVDLSCTVSQTCGPNELAVTTAFPNAVPASALAPFVPSGSFGRVRPISDHLRNPEMRHASFTIQRELNNTTVLSIGYVGAFGFGEYGERDANFPTINPDPAHPGFFYLGPRPDSRFTAVRTTENSRTSSYNGMMIDVNKRLLHHFQFHGGYTLSKLLSSAEDFYGTSEAGDPRNIRAERGLAYADARHSLNFALILDSEKTVNAPGVKHIINDWQVGLNGNLHSGQPYSVSTGLGPFSGSTFFGVGAETQQRPNVLPGGSLSVTNIPSSSGGNMSISQAGVTACQQIYGTAPGNCPTQTTFLAPAGASPDGPLDSLTQKDVVDFQFLNGNLARNSGKSDPFYRFDLSLTRSFHIRESLRLELRADFFNVFNHTNFLGFNGLDVLTNFAAPSLTIQDATGNPAPNPNFNSRCTSCLNPFTGQFVGAGGQALKIQDLQHGRVSPKTDLYSVFNGLGDPAVADIARQIQLSVHMRW
jgi:hypothetical protein